MRNLLLCVLLTSALTFAAAIALADDNPTTAQGDTPTATKLQRQRAYQTQANTQARRAVARAKQRQRAHSHVAVPAALQTIAACESGGNPHAVGGGGAFRGKYQFDYGTWASVGGHGDPAAAPEAEQDRRAAALYARSGATPWPVCGAGA